MRELNTFNKNVLQTFSSRQAYTFIKGQYVPIIMNNITDESVTEVEKRQYYIQSYDFTMLGYLIDEEEFQVKPAVARVVQLFETDVNVAKGKLTIAAGIIPVKASPGILVNTLAKLGIEAAFKVAK